MMPTRPMRRTIGPRMAAPERGAAGSAPGSVATDGGTYPGAVPRRLAPQFWQKPTPARLWVPQRGQAMVPSGVPGRSTVLAMPAATSRWPQLWQNDRPGRFSVPQRGHWVLSPTAPSPAGTACAAVASAAASGVDPVESAATPGATYASTSLGGCSASGVASDGFQSGARIGASPRSGGSVGQSPSSGEPAAGGSVGQDGSGAWADSGVLL